MKKMLCILALIAVLISHGNAFAERTFDVLVSGADVWGVPALTDPAGTPIRGNVFGKLHAIYTSPDFPNKRDQALASENDADGLLVLSAIWKDVAAGEARDALRDAVVKRLLGIDLQEVAGMNDVLATEVFREGYEWPHPPVLADYMELMLLDRFRLLFPSVGESGNLLDGAIGRALLCRFHHYVRAAGEEKNDEFLMLSAAEKLVSSLPVGGKFSSSLYAQTELFKEVLSREPWQKGVGSTNAGRSPAQAVSMLGEKDSGVRLFLALERKAQDSSAYKAEIAQLCAESFSPAFPFMEEICLEERRFEDAAYFHYLSRRNPMNMTAFLELAIKPSFSEKLLRPQLSRYFSELMDAELYDDAVEFCAYATVLLNREKSRGSCELAYEMERRLARAGKRVSFRDLQPWLGNVRGKNYTNARFERRRLRELAQLENTR